MNEKKFLQNWHRYLSVYFLIVFTIFLAYAPTLFYSTVNLDDHILVEGQYEFNKNIANITKAFKQDIFQSGNSFYRPLLRLTFMWDAQFGKTNLLFMSHLTNIILHIATTCLLFALLIKLQTKKGVAIWFSLFFALHPLVTQTVSWIPGRNDSLLAVFVLTSFIFFINFLETKKVRHLLLHLVFFIFALGTKETAVILPAVLLIHLFSLKKQKPKECLKQYAGIILAWIVIIILYLTQRVQVLGNLVGNTSYDLLDSIIQNSASILPTIGKIIFPFNLSVHPIIEDMPIIYGLWAIILIILYSLLSKGKNYSLLMFGVAWFLLFMIPTFIQPSNTLIIQFENRIYLPMIGFVFIFLGLGRVNFNRRFVAIVLVTLLTCMSLITLNRNPNYKNPLSFWGNATRTSPSNVYAHGHLGALYEKNGELDKAIEEFKITIALDPAQKFMHHTHKALGEVYLKQGRIKEAEEMFRVEEQKQ